MSASMSLVDDLADVLACMVVGWGHDDLIRGDSLSQHPDVIRVMQRYRDAKAEYDNLVITLQMKEAEVNAVFDAADAALDGIPKGPRPLLCRKCGGVIKFTQYRFGNGDSWEHMEGECSEEAAQDH